MDLQFKSLPFELKAAAPDGSTFEGLVSVFHNIDSYGEIVDDGAFSGDLDAFLRDGFIGGLNHDWDNPIGTPQPGTKITDRGLFLKANVIDTSHGQDVRKMLKAGVVRKLSIGYQTLGAELLETADDVAAYWERKGYEPTAQDLARAQHGARVLTRVRLYEGSPVTVPANDLAAITAVKAAAAKALLVGVPEPEPEEKTATGKTTWPIGARDAEWDSGAAVGRIRSATGSEDAPSLRYRQCFFWMDPDSADKFGGYKLPFCDVVSGKVTAMPRAIMACAGAMMGARGGVDIPEADRAAVKRKIATYYARMREMFDDPEMVMPGMEKPGKNLDDLSSLSDVEDYLREVGSLSRKEAKDVIHALKTLLREAASESESGHEPDEQADPPAEEPEQKASATPAETPAPPAADPPAPPAPDPADEVPPAIKAQRERIASTLYSQFMEQAARATSLPTGAY